MRKRSRWAAWLAAALAITAVGEAQAGGYNFTTIAPSGEMVTSAEGITGSGVIVGYYTDSSDVEHGFLYNNGSFTNIDYPTGSPATTNTLALGINPGGTSTSYSIVGVYNNNGTLGGGYLDSSGTISAINDPLAVNGTTRPTGINDSGAIVGSYSDGTSSHGFLDVNGTFTPIDATTLGATNTYALGINNSGAIVGYYGNSSGQFGFVDNNGTFTTLDPQGATFTRATGINGAGDIVGFYENSNGNEVSYLYNPITSTYTYFTDPNATDTLAQGINGAGDIVGLYEDSSGHEFGFLATPAAGPAVPEPSSAVMGVLGGLAVLGLAWRNRRGARAVTTRHGG